MKKIGLARGTVKLVPYDNQWKTEFEEEAVRLSKVLGLSVNDFHHVGSTAIPQLWAKPIIDILFMYDALPELSSISTLLVGLNYEYRENGSHKGKYFFAKGSTDNRTHYLHIYLKSHPDSNHQLAFRDALIKNQTLREEYQTLKKELSGKYSMNRSEYTTQKGDFIKKVLDQHF